MTPADPSRDRAPGKNAPAERAHRPCPVCGMTVAPTAEFAPFCCERCRLVDLGRWFSGSYKVTRDIAPDDDIETLPRTGEGD